MRFTLGQLRKTVTAAGSREALTALNILSTNIVIQALSGNGGVIYIGDASVSSVLNAVTLAAGVAITLSPGAFGEDYGTYNLKEIYIDTSNSGDGVNVGYTTTTPGLA